MKLGVEVGKEGPQTLIPTAFLAPLPAPSFLSHYFNFSPQWLYLRNRCSQRWGLSPQSRWEWGQGGRTAEREGKVKGWDSTSGNRPLAGYNASRMPVAIWDWGPLRKWGWLCEAGVEGWDWG